MSKSVKKKNYEKRFNKKSAIKNKKNFFFHIFSIHHFLFSKSKRKVN